MSVENENLPGIVRYCGLRPCTTEQILDTLKVMNVMNFQDTFYASAYTESEVGIALNAAFDLGLNKKYYKPKELNKKLKNILK